MTKSDLIDVFAAQRGISRQLSEQVINKIFKIMSQTLIDGKRIEIRGFGSFEAREYDGYTARNPKTGVEVQVAPKKSPFFKTGKDLKERIQGI